MKTYYKIVSAGLSVMNNFQRGETRIQARKPEDHELASGDRVYTMQASSIEEARVVESGKWTRKPSLEL